MSNSNISTNLEGLGYAYDKVKFQPKKPPLAEELNIAQELQEILTQKSTAHFPSGWLSYRPFHTSKELDNAFYTQDPDGAKPEVALVNGWPIYVTNTGTPLRHVNKISLDDNQLRSGSRVDSVFLEVWRAEISPVTSEGESEDIIRPEALTKVSDLNDIFMYNENVGWAVGNDGVILKTVDGGNLWNSVNTPLKGNYRKIKFIDDFVGFIVGDKGIILKSLDGGNTWFTLESPVTDDLLNFYIVDRVTICIVGRNGTVLLSTNATTFTIVPDTGGVTTDLHGVFFYDVSVGWAIGDHGTLIITRNGGQSWQKYLMINSFSGQPIESNISSIAFYNINDGIVSGSDGVVYRTSDGGATWSNVSDRIWHNGEYVSLRDVYLSGDIDLKDVFIRPEYPIKLMIGIYPDSVNYFKNVSYSISPAAYPNSMVFEYTGVQDNKNYVTVLDLDLYANSEELKDAINSIISPYLASDSSLSDESRQKIRVFEAFIEFEPFGQPSDFRPVTASISSSQPAELSFSVENKAWIVGDNGIVLTTVNSGAKWELLNINTEQDLSAVFFVDTNLGWFTGDNGTIIKYDGTGSSLLITEQPTDLRDKTSGRLYPEGNILSEAEEYLTDNIIDPQVGVETSKRVQIQYRIRVVDGVDPHNFPEAGLGHAFLYSLGPNVDTTSAGSYSYKNMGYLNGDYGLWRARCRNTVDGYSYAIPMFFITRRNSSTFNVDTNINGSTYFEQASVRPDGLFYEDIVDTDIVDIRRQININSYNNIFQKNLDKLLRNDLKVSIGDTESGGFQFGTDIFAVNTYNSVSEIESLTRGEINSTAVIVEDQKVFDPNIEITEDELTFGPIDNGLYHNDPAFYTAYIIRDSVVTNEPIQGTFEGLGTNTVKFNLDENFIPEGGTLEGIEYQITAHYLDYSQVGLDRVPQTPVSVRYRPDPNDTNDTYYFNAINTRAKPTVVEEGPENVDGYKDYVVRRPAIVIQDNQDDKDLYEAFAHSDPTSTDYQRGLNRFNKQQFSGTLVEYHYFFETASVATKVRVPKNLNEYTIFGVKHVQNVNGSVYKISAMFNNNETIRDRETVNSEVLTDDIIVYLDPAYAIPAESVVEVVCEAFIPADVFGGPKPDVNLTSDNKGQNQGALRTSLVANVNVASKGVEGLYVGFLYPHTVSNLTNTIIIDTSAATIPGILNASVMGISSFETRLTDNQMFVWYKPASDPEIDYFSVSPVQSVEGLGTSSIRINLDPDKSLNAGDVLIPMMLKLNTLPALTDASEANVFYRYVPYQTVGNLPDELKLEVVSTSEFVYASNLGTGSTADILGEPYEIPINHIAQNDDTIPNDNMFSNIDDLEFSQFSIDGGFVKLPGYIATAVGEDIILSKPNNVGDRLGRTFYEDCSLDMMIEGSNLTISTPRKVFWPMLGRVRTDITSPLMRGEIVLIIFSKVYKARTENRTGIYEDRNEEYTPGYFESSKTAISLYRLTNKPIVRK